MQQFRVAFVAANTIKHLIAGFNKNQTLHHAEIDEKEETVKGNLGKDLGLPLFSDKWK